MSNKRKKDAEDAAGGDVIEDEEKVQALKAKRVKGKQRVTFAEKQTTREFNVDAELTEEQAELVEGDRITKVLGEEEPEEWSDEEVEVEPFNLRSENEEGYFDRNGNYVENKIEKGVEDAWLDEYDEKWAKKFAENKSKISKQNRKDDDDDKPVVHDKIALLKTVVELLQAKESVTTGLKRLSGGGATGAAAKKGKGNNNNSGKGATKEGRDMEKFNKLTEAADALLNSGYNNIYSDKKEKVEYELETELAIQGSSLSSSEVKWEYKGQDGALFGPYTSANMREWRAQGYFTGDAAVQIRKVKDPKQEEEDDMFSDAPQGDGFVSSDTIDFSQYP